ncbi:MAG: lysophospholipid acyltransferase family protein [Prosthecobacter sp.]
MMRRIIASLTRLFSGVRLLHRSPHGDGPAVFFANHTSHLDFAVVWAALPHDVREQTSPAAAEDYWSKSRLRRWIACDLFQAVLIAREGITRENNPLERLSACLESGRSILIFPEGTRRTDGEVSAFKAGLFHLARRFPHIPLVPVHLDNLNRIMPKGAWVPVPLIAQAHFREPIRMNEGESKADFLTRARAALLDQAEST